MNASAWIALVALVGAAIAGSVRLLWMAATFFKGMRDDLHMLAVDMNEHVRKDEQRFEVINEDISVLKINVARVQTHIGLEAQ